MKINKIKLMVTTIGLSLLQLQSFAAKKDCVVKGKIVGIDEKTTLVVVKRTGEFTVDTVASAKFNAKGEFKFVVPEKEFNEVLDVRLSTIRSSFSFIAESGNIDVLADKNTLYKAEIKGTKENVRWNLYKDYTISLTQERNKLSTELKSMPKEEKLLQYAAIDKRQKHYVDSLIQNFPNSIVSLYLAKIPLPMLKHDEIESLLEKFRPYFAKHRYYQEMKERFDILRKISVGMMAPDFKAVREDGKTEITLSQFKGKYVLLDFWASWCVPCRAENKHTKELYEKYHPLGLEAISFSLDDNLKAWQEAIKKDGLVWNNASDLKVGKLSPVAKLYGIDGLPAIWIIDPTGKVIGDNIRGEELKKFLAELFVK